MTPGEDAEATLRGGGTYGNRRLARALVDMRAAVHGIHWEADTPTESLTYCDECSDADLENYVWYPCRTIRAVEAVWDGHAS